MTTSPGTSQPLLPWSARRYKTMGRWPIQNRNVLIAYERGTTDGSPASGVTRVNADAVDALVRLVSGQACGNPSACVLRRYRTAEQCAEHLEVGHHVDLGVEQPLDLQPVHDRHRDHRECLDLLVGQAGC